MAHFTKAQWFEISGFGLLAALAAWILYHAKSEPAVSNSEPFTPKPVEPITIPQLGYTPKKLPNFSGDHCNCGCPGGQTTPSTIQQIVTQTNAVIAQMQEMVNQTVQAEADIGNQVGGVFVHYDVRQLA